MVPKLVSVVGEVFGRGPALTQPATDILLKCDVETAMAFVLGGLRGDDLRKLVVLDLLTAVPSGRQQHGMPSATAAEALLPTLDESAALALRGSGDDPVVVGLDRGAR